MSYCTRLAVKVCEESCGLSRSLSLQFRDRVWFITNSLARHRAGSIHLLVREEAIDTRTDCQDRNDSFA